jgi:hypothetical protein
MRGCLSVLILAAVFLVAFTWFGAPPLAGVIVQAGLTGAGIQSDDLEVNVTADPPLALALGRADRVAISGTDVRWNDVRAGSLNLAFDDVDFLARTAESAFGSLEGVAFEDADGNEALGSVAFDGPADAADTAIRLPVATVQDMAARAIEREFGTAPEDVQLVGPNIMRIRTPAGTLDGTLEIGAGGALVVRSSLGTSRLVTPDASLPLRLTDVEVVGGELELSGTTDLTSLLG